MDIFKEIALGVQKGDSETVLSLTEKALAENVSPKEILHQALVAGMDVIGERFKNNEVFIPEVLVSAKAMKAGMNIVKPLLADADVESKGKVVIGTVKGDLHDIGKNIVGMLLEGGGYDVIDLGADVPKEKFLEAIQKENANILGMSALLTTTMTYMREIIEALEFANLKSQVKVMIGGAPITQAYADEIKADGYAPDAASAVDLAQNLLNK